MSVQDETVTDYMTKKLITFTADMDIKEATKVLMSKKISGAPVLDDKKNLIGMLSEKDCIQLIVDGQYNQRPTNSGSVGEFMSKNVKTLDKSATILEAAYQFVHSPYRRFPVLDNGKLVGQISRSDVLRAVNNHNSTIKHTPSSWGNRVPS